MAEFTCREVLFDGANNPERCRCKGAALRAYSEMKQSGASECIALDAAYKIYRYHHPLDTTEDSRLTVERWVNEGRFH